MSALQAEEAQQRLRARVRVKTLAMWTDQGRLGQELCKVGLTDMGSSKLAYGCCPPCCQADSSSQA